MFLMGDGAGESATCGTADPALKEPSLVSALGYFSLRFSVHFLPLLLHFLHLIMPDHVRRIATRACDLCRTRKAKVRHNHSHHSLPKTGSLEDL